MANGRFAAIAALGVFSLVTPVLAQSAPAPAAPPAPSDKVPVVVERRAPANDVETEREVAVRELPKWESYGSGNDQNRLDETFFRLAQDFVSTSEVGVRRLGHVPIWPRGELKFGPVRILPYFREAVNYDSNIYRKPVTGRRNDDPDRPGRQTGWTQVSQLGGLADMMLNGGKTRLSLSVDSRWYTRYRQDQPDDWEIDAQIGASHRINDALWTSAGYAYERRSEPIAVQDTSRFKRTNNRGFAKLGANKDILFGTRLNYEVGMDWRDVRGKDDQLDDNARTETTAYVKVSYPFWRDSTRIFTRVIYRDDDRDSDKLNDGDVWSWDAGMEGSVPLTKGGYRGLRGQISFGFDHGEYDDGTYSEGTAEYRKDQKSRDTSLRVNAALQYIMSPRTTMDLRYQRTNQFSYYGNYQIVDRLDYTFTHNITPKLVGRFATFWEYSNPSSGYDSPTYADGERPRDQSRQGTVTRGGVGVGFRYPIEEWMDVDVSLDYERRNGYDQSDTYTNYRGVLGVTFYFSGLNPPTKPTFLDM